MRSTRSRTSCSPSTMEVSSLTPPRATNTLVGALIHTSSIDGSSSSGCSAPKPARSATIARSARRSSAISGTSAAKACSAYVRSSSRTACSGATPSVPRRARVRTESAITCTGSVMRVSVPSGRRPRRRFSTGRRGTVPRNRPSRTRRLLATGHGYTEPRFRREWWNWQTRRI